MVREVWREVVDNSFFIPSRRAAAAAAADNLTSAFVSSYTVNAADAFLSL